MFNVEPLNMLKILIFNQCTKNFFYDELRAKYQIGYIPQSLYYEIDGVVYFLVGINGVRHTPNEIDTIIDNSINIALNTPCTDYDLIKL